MLKQLTLICGIALMVSSCTTTDPLTATNNELGDKTGSVANTCLLGAPVNPGIVTQQQQAGIVPGGKLTSAGICLNNDEYYISEAASRANIKKVAAVDLRTTTYLLWTKYELVVHGK